ncbi:tape measure protein [Rhodococcus hoagii]|nr:tape measure protein [Prescottella equi]
MAQMLERQIPIFDILGKKYGKSAEEIQKMVSDGKVSFADFAGRHAGQSRRSRTGSGATVRGAAKNMGAALGRLGEAALAPFFGQATTVFGGVTGLIDKMTTRVKVWSEQVGNGLEFVKGILIEGDFKGEVAKALDIDEDAPIVESCSEFREQIQRAFEGVKCCSPATSPSRSARRSTSRKTHQSSTRSSGSARPCRAGENRSAGSSARSRTH